MTRKILLALLLLIAIGYGILKFLSNATRMEWGHHFTFENELGIEIDSLEIAVGGVKTLIHAKSDSLHTLDGKIGVPTTGYPHQVTFRIFSNNHSMTLQADSFDCYNCDGSHEYTLKDSVAAYRFLN